MQSNTLKLSEELILAGADIANKSFEALRLIGEKRRAFSEEDKERLTAIAEKFNEISKITRAIEELAAKIKETK